jgi:hypothetical protein
VLRAKFAHQIANVVMLQTHTGFCPGVRVLKQMGWVPKKINSSIVQAETDGRRRSMLQIERYMPDRIQTLVRGSDVRQRRTQWELRL